MSQLRKKFLALLVGWLGFLALVGFAFGDEVEIEGPFSDPKWPITIMANRASQWDEGRSEVWLLHDVEIVQGATTALAEQAVVWVQRSPDGSNHATKAIAHLEGEVRIAFGGGDARAKRPAQRLETNEWFGRFSTWSSVTFDTPMVEPPPKAAPLIYLRARQKRSPEVAPAGETDAHLELGDDGFRPRPLPDDVQPAQFNEGIPGGPRPVGQEAPVGSAVGTGAGSGIRRVQIFRRGTLGWQARTQPNPNDPSESITTITGGVQAVIDTGDEYGVVSLETDRIVIWSPPFDKRALAGDGSPFGGGPIEFYMEGNIVFRQGDRLIYADRMYYNVTQSYGVVLGAELLTPVPNYQGLVRLKADVLQQVDKQNFLAYGAALTTSRLGVPRYWVQSERIGFQDTPRAGFEPTTSAQAIDPTTGEPRVEHDLLATSRNNFVYLAGAPVFYWPYLASDLRKTNYFLNDISVSADRVFGQQLHTSFDAYQLLGVRNAPAGTAWNVRSDYLSRRGFGFGTDFTYAGDSLPYLAGPYRGFIDGWFIQDKGRDNLGLGRRSLSPEEKSRYRVLGRHRQDLNDWQATAELGLISDRNFLEQYYESEWDTLKDQATGLELKRYFGAGSISVSGDVRLNRFFTETNWLPRFDFYSLGQDVLETATYTGHTSVGYAKLQTATTPLNAEEVALFQPLAWEANQEGLRFDTRHELALPFDLGPARVAPYVSGGYTHWGNDLNGASANRLLGQAGVRGSLSAWAADPTVRSELFYLNGLAHKSTLDADFFFAEASQDLTRFPLYDNIDDNAQEHFRRRFFFQTYGGAGGQIPLKFDERFFAFRDGLQGNITTPSAEIADDLMVARLGTRQRWQTKRGAFGQERIVDWITFDSHVSLFPRPNRDNFGQIAGLVDYDFKWHIGDRVSFLSDGYADFFGTGLKQINGGVLMTRPEVGNLYLGYRNTSGPFSTSAIVANVNYRLTEKWIANASATFDLANAGNIGQTVSFIRVGEAFLIQAGFRADVSRGNFGAVFMIEPRFLPNGRLGLVGGVPLPPAGTYGIE